MNKESSTIISAEAPFSELVASYRIQFLPPNDMGNDEGLPRAL